MSHLLRRLKLSLLRRNLTTSSRCFSSPPIYYVRGAESWEPVSSETISIPSLKVPMESLKEIGVIGASHGWVATLKNGVVCLQDGIHLPDTDPKRIPLPPFVTLPHCQTQIVTNVAMSSSSPDEDEDCIVAVKFLGPQLSLCRPAQKDCKWSNIRITDPSFFSSLRPLHWIMGSWETHKGTKGADAAASRWRFISGNDRGRVAEIRVLLYKATLLSGVFTH
ncbi:hypothetical protein Rs2_36251 [Raphanus sativus]|nr:hypothetical protein Rs2_48634 [Raphanus sativus]KAJ4879197.1 hypothetical protein Rs2_36251 [Raphanus sativus]